ncbi:creatininase [Devosia pacifica]|uniref:Creatininase n=1 Tax=Devosia pacifica TaxID=1335967 RepID=A0A918RS08_9HYPH|nr:creatininase family protein [Devosia pacifica]GHA10111.1 creatininase [Devosia pacifica]
MSTMHYWLHMTTADFAVLPKGAIALLPVGATEQHGPHMPVGTDTLINQGIVARMLELVDPALNLVVLPTQPVGTSTEHLDFPGTLSHDPDAIMSIWTTLLDTVVRAGISKVVLFNSHGGQSRLLQPVALQIRRRHGVLAAYASWFDAGYPAGLFDADEVNFGIHAGAIETAMMLHLHPELVRRDRITDFPSTAASIDSEFSLLQSDPGNGRIGGFGWMMQDLNPYGAAGDARRATPEAGRALVDNAAQALADLLAEIDRFDTSKLSPDTFLDGHEKP